MRRADKQKEANIVTTAELSTIAAPLVEAFEARHAERGREPAWLRSLREEAMARFTAVGIPTTRDEEWRHTNLKPLLTEGYLPQADGLLDVAALSAALQELPLAELDAHRLVFVDGRCVEALSSLDALPPGLRLGGIARVLAADDERLRSALGAYAEGREKAFAALNTALFHDGLWVEAEAGAEVERPILAVFASSGDGTRRVSFPRNLVRAGAGARLTVIEHFVALGPQPYWTNTVTEIVAGAGAVVNHYKLQRENRAALHTGFTFAWQDRDSTVESLAVAFGARAMRNEISDTLGGEGAHGELNGLYLATDEQLHDNHTLIVHAVPRCTSHELYKGILDRRARGVFRGRIHVWPNAQKTDAIQTSNGLLLSDEAVINAKPQLEIYADDVKCTHGATIGQLDKEMLFYLRARGIDEAEARSLLTFAFAAAVFERIGSEQVRRRLESLALEWLRCASGAESEALP